MSISPYAVAPVSAAPARRRANMLPMTPAESAGVDGAGSAPAKPNATPPSAGAGPATVPQAAAPTKMLPYGVAGNQADTLLREANFAERASQRTEEGAIGPGSASISLGR